VFGPAMTVKLKLGQLYITFGHRYFKIRRNLPGNPYAHDLVSQLAELYQFIPVARNEEVAIGTAEHPVPVVYVLNAYVLYRLTRIYIHHLSLYGLGKGA